MRDELARIGRRFIGDIQRDDVAGLAAELAYRFLFAIFPFGIFVAALTAFVAGAIGAADPTSRIMGALGDNLPADVAGAIRPQLEAVIGTTRPGLVTFGAVAALWAATGGTNALIKAMNRAWEVEETRPLIPRYGTAIGLTLLASVGIVVSFVTIVGASLVTSDIAGRLGLDAAAVAALSLLRWPVVFGLLSVAVAILYHWAPNFRAPWRWCLAGGALFSIAWIAATGLFALYVANFAHYANTYGALGGVIVLMLWLYLSSLLVVAAAALMAAILKERQPTTVHQRRVERGVAGAGTRATERTNAGPRPGTAPGVVVVVASSNADQTETKRSRPEPGLLRRRSRTPTYRMSGPEDWAVAGIVTATGATLGAIVAWLVGMQRRA